MLVNIFFLSYSESNADENWQLLQTRKPDAKRIHGIEGIKNAHKKIATSATTDFFFVIDGDNSILPAFDFAIPAQIEKNTLYVWRARNPVNDLCYGFGGIKLYNKWLLLDNTQPTTVDIATSIAPVYHPIMVEASITNFNATPEEAWRGAFRESTKLTLNTLKHPQDTASLQRLHAWKTKGETALNGRYAINGANMGHVFALENSNNPIAHANINNFEWLKTQFKNL
jgi:hypothetical protein